MDIKEIGDQVIAAVKNYVSKATEAINQRIAGLEERIRQIPAGPQGERGEKGMTGDRGQDGINGKDGTPGKDGERGTDGINGKDGTQGKDADPAEIAVLIDAHIEKIIPQLIAKAAALIPKPADGRDGRDGQIGKDGINGERGEKGLDGVNGQDGFSPDDLHLETLDGGRTIQIKLRSGEREIVREIQLAILLDRGVYKSGMKAEAGDGVTYGGSFWIARRKTDTVPSKSEDWRLAVKRGQDGKDLR